MMSMDLEMTPGRVQDLSSTSVGVLGERSGEGSDSFDLEEEIEGVSRPREDADPVATRRRDQELFLRRLAEVEPDPLRKERRRAVRRFRQRVAERQDQAHLETAPYAHSWLRTQGARDLASWVDTVDPSKEFLDPAKAPRAAPYWPEREAFESLIPDDYIERLAVLFNAIVEENTESSVEKALAFLEGAVGDVRLKDPKIRGAPRTPAHWLATNMLYRLQNKAIKRYVRGVDMRLTPRMRMDNIWDPNSPEALALPEDPEMPRDAWPPNASLLVASDRLRSPNRPRGAPVMSDISSRAGRMATWRVLRDTLRFVHFEYTFFENLSILVLFPGHLTFPNITHIYMHQVAFESAQGLNTLLKATYRMPNLVFLHINIHDTFSDLFMQYDDVPNEMLEVRLHVPPGPGSSSENWKLEQVTQLNRLPGYQRRPHPDDAVALFQQDPNSRRATAEDGVRMGLHIGRLYPTRAYTDRTVATELAIATHMNHGFWPFQHLRVMRLQNVEFAKPPLTLILSHILARPTLKRGRTDEEGADTATEREELLQWQYLRSREHPGIRAPRGTFSPDQLVPPIAQAEVGPRPQGAKASLVPRLEFLRDRRDILRERHPDWDRREWADLFPRLTDLSLYGSRPRPYLDDAHADAYMLAVGIWIERATLKSLASWNTAREYAREVATPLYAPRPKKVSRAPMLSVPAWRMAHSVLGLSGTGVDQDMTLHMSRMHHDVRTYVSDERADELGRFFKLWDTASVASHLRPPDALLHAKDPPPQRLVEYVAFAEEAVRSEQRRALRPLLSHAPSTTGGETAGRALGVGRSLRDGRGFYIDTGILQNRTHRFGRRNVALYRTIDRPLNPSLLKHWPILHLRKDRDRSAAAFARPSFLRPVGYPLVFTSRLPPPLGNLDPTAFVPTKGDQYKVRDTIVLYRTAIEPPPRTEPLSFATRLIPVTTTHLQHIELYRATLSPSIRPLKPQGDLFSSTSARMVSQAWRHLGLRLPHLRYLAIDGGVHAAEWARLFADPETLASEHLMIHERTGRLPPYNPTTENNPPLRKKWHEAKGWPFQNLTVLALRNLNMTTPPWGLLGVPRPSASASASSTWKTLSKEYPQEAPAHAHTWSRPAPDRAEEDAGRKTTLLHLNIFPSLLYLDLRDNALFGEPTTGRGAERPGPDSAIFKTLSFLEAWMRRSRRIGIAEREPTLSTLSGEWREAIEELAEEIIKHRRAARKPHREMTRVPPGRRGRAVNRKLGRWVAMARRLARDLTRPEDRAAVDESLDIVRREIAGGDPTGAITGGGDILTLDTHVERVDYVFAPNFHRLVHLEDLEETINTRSVFWANTQRGGETADGSPPYLLNFASLDLRRNGGPPLDRWPAADRQRLGRMRALMYFSHTNESLGGGSSHSRAMTRFLMHNTFEVDEGRTLVDSIDAYATTSGQHYISSIMPMGQRGHGFRMDGDEGAQELAWLFALSGAHILLSPMFFYDPEQAPEYGMGISNPRTVYGKYPPPGFIPRPLSPTREGARRYRARLEEARSLGTQPQRVLPGSPPLPRMAPTTTTTTTTRRQRALQRNRQARPDRFIAPRGPRQLR